MLISDLADRSLKQQIKLAEQFWRIPLHGHWRNHWKLEGGWLKTKLELYWTVSFNSCYEILLVLFLIRYRKKKQILNLKQMFILNFVSHKLII